MKIIHAPVDIAGQGGIYCKELRKRGMTVNGYNWYRRYFNYNSPIVHMDAYEVAKVVSQIYKYVDIVHFHNGSTLLPDYSDLPQLQRLGKKMVMQHWGNDVRDVAAVNQKMKYKLPPSYHTSEQIKQKLKTISTYIDHAIIQDFELYEHIAPFYKHIHFLPLAIDSHAVHPRFPEPDNPLPLIVHAPTNTEFKGTSYIETAIEQVKGTLPFKYLRIENMSNQEAVMWYAKADIVIDQIICGTYGLVSVEAMASGKPVIAYLRDDVRAHFPKNAAVVSSDPSRLPEVLTDLLKDGNKRHKLGRQGREYVTGYHDVQVVIPKLIDIYMKL